MITTMGWTSKEEKTLSVLIAVLISTSINHICAQQPGIYTPRDENPTITLRSCTISGGCTSRQAKLTLDADWRWIHSTSGSSNCYTGNQWSSQFCSDPIECAKKCVLEGVSSDEYRSTYGIEQVGDGVRLNFTTNHENGTSVGSRLYVMDESGDNYELFYLKNKEVSFDVDVSQLKCGQNGAIYFTEMEANGGLGIGDNNAGASFGTGYCDAQCPHDIKFINGEANVIDWKSNPNDISNNIGIGKYGACCAEMDVWEANSMATAFTSHTCGESGPYRCEGIECGDDDKSQRYDGVCDKDGCDINPYRMGNPKFYGRGPKFVVNTLEPMKVVTQFFTSDGTDNGNLVAISRFYVQNGKVIYSPSSKNLGRHNTDVLTSQYCDAKKDLFGDVKDFQEHGGMKAMDESLARGHTMIFSLLDDVDTNMLWLDSAYPLDKPFTDPGIKRGECPGGQTSTPTWLRNNYPDSYVIFTNVAIGEIGSTIDTNNPTNLRPPSPTPPIPNLTATPSSNPSTNPFISPSIAASVFPSTSPSMIPSTSPVESCIDNSFDTFFYEMKTLSDGTTKPIYKYCKWLSNRSEELRNEICLRRTESYGCLGPAKNVCRLLCNTCQGLTPTATPSPTRQPSSANCDGKEKCKDNPFDIFFYMMRNSSNQTAPIYRNCRWLSRVNDAKIKDICRNRTDSHGCVEPAQNVCRITCDKDNYAYNPTSSPLKEPTACVDNPGDLFFFRVKEKNNSTKFVYHDCEWLATKAERDINRMCKKRTDSYGGYAPAREVCKALCNTCHLTYEPSGIPTMDPTIEPTSLLSQSPSNKPSEIPTMNPTIEPTSLTSDIPSNKPSVIPTMNPTIEPTSLSSNVPSNEPRIIPTENPTITPTSLPSDVLVNEPSGSPSTSPSALITSAPSKAPSLVGPIRCCSQDYKTCGDLAQFCNANDANCARCDGIMIYGAPLQCLAKYAECTNDVQNCCRPSSCQGGRFYKQCLDNTN